jgi:hypothetical protein
MPPCMPEYEDVCVCVCVYGGGLYSTVIIIMSLDIQTDLYHAFVMYLIYGLTVF